MERTEVDVVQALMYWRAYASELRKLTMRLCSAEEGDIDERVPLLEQKLATLDRWLSVLDMNESLVVRLHLIEGRSWEQVEREFLRGYSKDASCVGNALYHYEIRAIQKICRLIREEAAYDDDFTL